MKAGMNRRWRIINLRTIVVIGMTLVAGWILFQTFKASKKNRNSVTDWRAAEISDKTSLQQLLDRGNLRQLVKRLGETSYTETDLPVVQLEQIRQKTLLADKILLLDPNDEQRHNAVSEKLRGLIASEKIAYQYGVLKTSQTIELDAVSSTLIESADNQLAKRAALGQAVAAISQLLQSEPSSPNRQSLLLLMREKIDTTAAAAPNDLEIAKILFDWVQIALNESDEEADREVNEAFIDGFIGSTNNAVAELAQTNSDLLLSAEVEPVQFLAAVPSEREKAIGQFLEQANSVLRINSNDREIVMTVLRKANDLLALGRVEDAKSIYDRTVKVSREENMELGPELEIMKTRLDLFNRPMELSGLLDLEGNPAAFRLPDARTRLMFFFSSATKTDTLPKFGMLIAQLGSKLKKGNLEIVAVYLDDGQNPVDLADIRVASTRDDKWSAWRLEIESPQGKQFLKSAGLGSSPYMIVLDNENRVISHGTTNQIVEEVVLKRQ